MVAGTDKRLARRHRHVHPFSVFDHQRIEKLSTRLHAIGDRNVGINRGFNHAEVIAERRIIKGVVCWRVARRVRTAALRRFQLGPSASGWRRRVECCSTVSNVIVLPLPSDAIGLGLTMFQATKGVFRPGPDDPITWYGRLFRFIDLVCVYALIAAILAVAIQIAIQNFMSSRPR